MEDCFCEPRRDLNLSKIKFLGSIYASQNDRFSVVIYKATHPDQPLLAIKEYTAKKDINDLEVYMSQITILETLSDRACEENCFLKYYGSWTVENKLYLTMEYVDHSLMSVITEYKKLNYHIGDDDLKVIIYKLISSFAQMEVMRIYHKDINPHNLLVAENFEIKMIDFSISEVKESMEFTSSITGMHRVQGTKGYMAPELQECVDIGISTAKFDLEKADVFSLGMTILQLLLLEDLFTMNRKENNHRLLERVNSIHIEWLKSLLHSMLELDYHERKSFRKLLALIPYRVHTERS